MFMEASKSMHEQTNCKSMRNEGIPAGNRGVQGVMAIFITLSRWLANDHR